LPKNALAGHYAEKNFERKFLGGGGKGNQHKKQILFAFLSGVVAFVPY
jgi:hypothetical protein